MAAFLPQFQMIKTCDHVVLAVEDFSDLWPVIKKGFEERLPFRSVFLNNKTRNPVMVNKLPAEFILTTDARLRSRFPQEQSLFWFREPYATIVLVTCEDLEEFKNILKPHLKLIVQNDEREWFIVYVSKAPAHNDQATKMAKKVYAKLEVDFSSKKRERCCKLDIHEPDANFWDGLEAKIVECIRNTLDRRIQFYEEEIRKLSEMRFMPVWNFCNFFILKESLAFMFEIAHLHEDALREYDELELCYLETVYEASIFNWLWSRYRKKSGQQMILKETSRPKHFDIQRRPLPLESSLLLREANRHRASLSAGNMFELFDARPNAVESSGLISPSPKVNALSMSRTLSSPGNFEGTIDRPMRLTEIYVAAEHALRNTISDAELWKSFSSVAEFEQKYLDLSKGAANNYHNSWWKRHGVVLDGEIAAVYHKRSNYDIAANLYEKVCALYAGEGWENLLAEVLPNLAECQKILNDQAGYLSSCVRLLSLDKGLFSLKERQAFQSEVVCLAHGEIEHPVPLDVSSLITFSGNPGPALELCDGDPGILSVTLWSGFPDDMTVESLSLTLTATHNTDEGAKAIKSSDAIVLMPGKNTITLPVPPQKPGSYVLGALTGHIGQLSFRSHSFSRVGPVGTLTIL